MVNTSVRAREQVNRKPTATTKINSGRKQCCQAGSRKFTIRTKSIWSYIILAAKLLSANASMFVDLPVSLLAVPAAIRD